VDRVFGGENEYSEYEDESNGRASVTLGWDEQDGAEVDLRFRASVNLPQINDRFNATMAARRATNTSPTASADSIPRSASSRTTSPPSGSPASATAPTARGTAASTSAPA
jgi:hypothetical protein